MKKEEVNVKMTNKEKVVKEIKNLAKQVLFVEFALVAVVAVIEIVVLVGLFMGKPIGKNTVAVVSEVQEEGLRAEIVDDCNTIAFFCGICALDYLRRLFKEIGEKETPFTEKTKQLMKKISVLLFLSIILSSHEPIMHYSIYNESMWISIINEFVLIFVVYAIPQIFAFGYELQKESEETV